MSYVIAAPELVEAAAQNLAGIQSSLGQVTAAAASPTTGILAAGADEVSTAISQLFGTYGNEFQALSAQAAAFHQEFVGLLNAGAGAYATAEATGAQSLLTAGGAPSLFQGFGSLAETATNPFQGFIATTTANLQGLGSALAADPAPILNQLISNQSAYGRTIATGFANAIQNLPAESANIPADIQGAFQALTSANPGAVVQGIVNNQMGYANLIGTSLQHAGNDLVTGINEFPTFLQNANQAFAAGNVSGGLQWIGGGLLNPIFSGLDVATMADGSLSITPIGALGDLLPIFSIPGQMAQNFTNLLPAGSVPAQISQNFTNLINTLTDTSVTSTATLVLDGTPPFGFQLDLNTHMGLPLALAIDAIGGPANALNALGGSASSFVNAAQTGDMLGAATAAVSAPGAVVNGFLNGQMTLPLQVDALGFPTTLNVPLSGILVNPAPYSAVAVAEGLGSIPGVVTGTPLGGLLPSLLSYLPREIAAAFGAPAPVIPPLAA